PHFRKRLLEFLAEFFQSPGLDKKLQASLRRGTPVSVKNIKMGDGLQGGKDILEWKKFLQKPSQAWRDAQTSADVKGKAGLAFFISHRRESDVIDERVVLTNTAAGERNIEAFGKAMVEVLRLVHDQFRESRYPGPRVDHFMRAGTGAGAVDDVA